MKISTENFLLIEIFNWFRKNISKSSNYFNKGMLFAEIYFSSNFFVWKKRKNFNKTIFSNISKQIGKNLIISIGRGYLVPSRKMFKLGTYKSFLKSYE